MLWKTISIRRGRLLCRPTVVMSMTPPRASAPCTLSSNLESCLEYCLESCMTSTTSARRRSIHGLPSAGLLPAVPVAGDLYAVLTGGGVGQHRIDRSRLLAAVQDERDLVAAPALPHLGGITVVHFDGHARVLIGARATEVVDLEHDPPDIAADVYRPVEDVGPGLAVVRPSARALALQDAHVGNDPGHMS